MSADRITLTGLRVRGFHGVYPEERRAGQDFLVDVVLSLDLAPAAASDAVADTVHYGELAEALAAVVAGEPVDLIETLAQRLADVCLSDPRVQVAEVTVHKPTAPIPLTFTDVAVTFTRRRSGDLIEVDRPPRYSAGDDELARVATRVVLSIGSNLGDRVAHLRAAVAAFRDVLVAVSPVYETPPWGPVEQPSYLNAVLLVEGPGTPSYWLGRAHAAEQAAGRERDVRWGPRTLDVDLVAVGDVLSADPALMLPHPRAHEREFVLRPWSDVEPDAVLAGRPVRHWLTGLTAADVVRRDDLDIAPLIAVRAP